MNDDSRLDCLDAFPDESDENIFSNCNVCGRKLHYAEEYEVGMCNLCANEWKE